MTEYIYRIDTQTGLQKISGLTFRARRWVPESPGTFPHQVLQKARSNIPQNHALYRICFYSSLERARQSLKDDFGYLGVSHILRSTKDKVLEAGFQESWDDGFNLGDAYLFWIAEDSDSTQRFSSAGISIEDFEIYKDQRWDSLKNHIVVAAETPAGSATTLLPPLLFPNSKNRPWWKFW